MHAGADCPKQIPGELAPGPVLHGPVAGSARSGPAQTPDAGLFRAGFSCRHRNGLPGQPKLASFNFFRDHRQPFDNHADERAPAPTYGSADYRSREAGAN